MGSNCTAGEEKEHELPCLSCSKGGCKPIDHGLVAEVRCDLARELTGNGMIPVAAVRVRNNPQQFVRLLSATAPP